MATIRDCCAQHGIELRGDDLHPWHCGEHMTTHEMMGDVWGATCKACGLRIINVCDSAGNGHLRMSAGLASVIVLHEDEWRDDWWFRVEDVPDDVLALIGLERRLETHG